MNKKLIPLIGIGALAGSAAWLLAKKHLKKPEPSEFDFEDDPLLDYSDPDFREIDTYSRIYPGSDKKSCGHIMNYELRDALRLLFSTYSDEEIAEYSVCLGETDVDLREYWVNTLSSLLHPLLNHSWRSSPHLEAYGSHSIDLVGKHGEIFDSPACILISDQLDCIYDRFCAVEHNLQLWISDEGELAVVTMFGFMRGPMVLGYYDLNYIVDEDSALPWTFRSLMTMLYRLIDNGLPF